MLHDLSNGFSLPTKTLYAFLNFRFLLQVFVYFAVVVVVVHVDAVKARL
jgi:hypothetical protein